MEDGLVLVVAQLEVFFRAMEVLFEHGHVIFLQSVVQGQVAIVILYVRSGSNLIDDRQLLLNADNMFDSLTLEVLHATRLEELVVTAEPIEDVFKTVTGTFKQWILSQVVSKLERLKLITSKDLEHIKVLLLSRDKDRCVSFEISRETFFGLYNE